MLIVQLDSIEIFSAIVILLVEEMVVINSVQTFLYQKIVMFKILFHVDVNNVVLDIHKIYGDGVFNQLLEVVANVHLHVKPMMFQITVPPKIVIVVDVNNVMLALLKQIKDTVKQHQHQDQDVHLPVQTIQFQLIARNRNAILVDVKLVMQVLLKTFGDGVILVSSRKILF